VALAAAVAGGWSFLSRFPNVHLLQLVYNSFACPWAPVRRGRAGFKEGLVEVILRQAVDNLGHPGDVVTVSNGYARNFLLPRGVAFLATEGNKKRITQEKARLEAAEAARRDAAQQLADRLGEVSITFAARVGEEGKLFGSVTAADIAQQLEAQGHHVERRQIDLHEPIRALGVYRVPIRLHADVRPEIKVWVIKQ
jgi:large subunit ribosomal protein L9